jgi:hypothetical protein
MSKTLLTTYDGDIAKVADRIATLRENDAMDILFTPILTRLTVDDRITDFMRTFVVGMVFYKLISANLATIVVWLTFKTMAVFRRLWNKEYYIYIINILQ